MNHYSSLFAHLFMHLEKGKAVNSRVIFEIVMPLPKLGYEMYVFDLHLISQTEADIGLARAFILHYYALAAFSSRIRCKDLVSGEVLRLRLLGGSIGAANVFIR